MRAGQSPVERDEMVERDSPRAARSGPITACGAAISSSQVNYSAGYLTQDPHRRDRLLPFTTSRTPGGSPKAIECLLARSQYPGSAARGTTGGFHAIGFHRTYRLSDPHLLVSDF